MPDGKYPFVVALENSGFQFCGRSVVAPTWVMTAAHCMTNSSGTENILASNLHVIIGRYDLITTGGEDRRRNSTGAAEREIVSGGADWLPIAGAFRQ